MPANEQLGVLWGDRNALMFDTVMIIQLGGNTHKFIEFYIQNECICAVQVTQRGGQMNKSGDSLHTKVLIGESRSCVYRCLLYSYFTFAGCLKTFIIQ